MARRLHCRTYSHCLSVCDREGWELFHCNHCKAFRPIGAEQGLIDAARLVEMVAEAHARVTLKNKAYGYYTTRKGV